jgi:PAS domain S-box-containing protein
MKSGADMDLSNREIGERAYAIWESNGMPAGTELDDWLTAYLELGQSGSLARELVKGAESECSHLLSAILDNAKAIISIKDTGGRYLRVNRRFETLYHISSDELTNKTDYDLFSPAQADVLRANDLRVIANGRSIEFEQVVPCEDGDRTFITLKFPVARPGEHPYAVCGISTDITEQKQAQRCLVVHHAVTLALNESLTFEEAGPRLLRGICQGLGWDVGLLWEVDATAKLLRCIEVCHEPDVPIPTFERMSRCLTMPPGVGLPGHVWSAGHPIWIANVTMADNFPRLASALADGLHGACGFPIQNGGKVLGVMEFFSREIRPPDLDLLQMMSGISSHISQFIERRQAEQALLGRAREFAVARSIQLGILPKVLPHFAGFALGGVSHPAKETGGDYLDFFPLSDGSLGLAIGDASGHGLGAALVMAETRAFLRARATTDTDVGQVLTLINRQLTTDLPTGHFVTLFFARLDGQSRTLTYSSAGHWPGYILDARGELRQLLKSTNFPLGIVPTAEFPVSPPVTLRPGDVILLMTDGILEAASPDGEMFGQDRVLDVIRACRGDSPDAIITSLLGAVSTFSSETQADDMTAIIVKVNEPLARR